MHIHEILTLYEIGFSTYVRGQAEMGAEMINLKDQRLNWDSIVRRRPRC